MPLLSPSKSKGGKRERERNLGRSGSIRSREVYDTITWNFYAIFRYYFDEKVRSISYFEEKFLEYEEESAYFDPCFTN